VDHLCATNASSLAISLANVPKVTAAAVVEDEVDTAVDAALAVHHTEVAGVVAVTVVEEAAVAMAATVVAQAAVAAMVSRTRDVIDATSRDTSRVIAPQKLINRSVIIAINPVI